jgi:hypothetical protein
MVTGQVNNDASETHSEQTSLDLDRACARVSNKLYCPSGSR